MTTSERSPAAVTAAGGAVVAGGAAHAGAAGPRALGLRELGPRELAPQELAPRALALRALHRPGFPLVLPNVWDAGSARAVEAAGFGAVATSSGAVAESLGYADGEAAPVDEMLDAVARIARAVSVPVTADMERGYGLPPAELVERLVATGAVGMNLEDSDPSSGVLVDPSRQSAFLSAVREAAGRAGVDLVINARIDVYLPKTATEAAGALDQAIRRAHAYLAAGADCVYPILMASREDIRTFVVESGGPVNVLSRPGAPNVTELTALGVARISFGTGMYRATQAHLAELISRVLD
jgi:2-methylisocitrate lyase-like PEP mutase family enzyme